MQGVERTQAMNVGDMGCRLDQPIIDCNHFEGIPAGIELTPSVRSDLPG